MGNCKSKNNQLHVIQLGLDAKHGIDTNPTNSAFRYDKSAKQIYFVGDESTAILTGSSETISSFGESGLDDEHDHPGSVLPVEEPKQERSLLEDIVEYLENDDESTVQTQTTCSKSSPDSNDENASRSPINNEFVKDEGKSMDNSVISVNLAKDFVSPLAIDNGNFDKLKDNEEGAVEASQKTDENEQQQKEEVEGYISYPIEQIGSSESNFFYCSSSDSGDTNSLHQPYAANGFTSNLNYDSNLSKQPDVTAIFDEDKDINHSEQKSDQQINDNSQSEIDALENVSYSSYQDIATTLDQAVLNCEKDNIVDEDSCPQSNIDSQERDKEEVSGPEFAHVMDHHYSSEESDHPGDEHFDDDVISTNEKGIPSDKERDVFGNLKCVQTDQSELTNSELSPISADEILKTRKEESYAMFAEETRLELCHLKGEVQEELSTIDDKFEKESLVVTQNELDETEYQVDTEVQKSNDEVSLEIREEEAVRITDEELRSTAEEQRSVPSNDDDIAKATKFHLHLSHEDFDYLENEIGNSISSDTSPLVSPVSDNGLKPPANAKNGDVQCLDEDFADHVPHASPVRHNSKRRESSIPRISLNSPLRSNSPYRGDRPTKIPTPSRTPSRKEPEYDNSNVSFKSHGSSGPQIPFNSPLRLPSPYRGEVQSKPPTPSKTPPRIGLKLPSPASSLKSGKAPSATPASQSIGVKSTTSASSAMSNFSEFTVDSLPFDEVPAKKKKTKKNRVSNRNSQCSGNWEPYLFFEKRGCERCLSLATVAERDAFFQKGKHAHITNTCGGCHRLCNKYSGPRFYDDDAVHMCRLCFNATHSRNHVSRNLSSDYA